MKAVILAAGRGSRMGSLTAAGPKCWLEVHGRTLLDRQVAALRAAGADEVGVVTGWHRDRFVDCVDLTIMVNYDWAHTTMVGSLAVAEPWLANEPVLVTYGDIVFTSATARAVATGEQQLTVAYDPNWLALWTQRSAAPLADAETFRLDADRRLVDIGGRPASHTEHGQYMGLLKFTPPAWAALSAARSRAGEHADMTALLRQVVAAGEVTVGAVPVDGPWCEVDTEQDLHVGRAIVREIDRREAVARRAQRG